MAVTEIVKGLHAVPVSYVNAFLLDGPDGLTLVDAGLPGKEGVILDALRGLGRAPGDLRHIVLTPAPPDHSASLAALTRATGAQTWIHALDAPIVERGTGVRPMTAAPGLLPRLIFTFVVRGGTATEPCAIDHLIADGELLPVAGGLRAVHAPGHCAGQVALLWEGLGVLFAADVCSNVMGLGPPICYEDRAEGERSQRKIAALDFDTACFGHGKAIPRGAAKRFRAKFG